MSTSTGKIRHAREKTVDITRTHFKEVIELSQVLNKTIREIKITPINDANDYINGKLKDIRQRRMLGMRINHKDMEKDNKLSLYLSRAANEVMDVYQIRKSPQAILFKKGDGKLMWNQTRLRYPLSNN